MSLFPAFLKLANRPVLVVGGGAIASSKIPVLLESGARVTIVSPKLTPELTERAERRELVWRPKHFEPADFAGQFLVISATAIPDLNAFVFREADRRGILCNTVDDNEHCHFYFGAVVRRGDLQIAISTNGKSPALAQRLRKELEAQFGPEYGPWLDHLGAARETLRANSTDPEATRRQLHDLASPSSFARFLSSRSGDPAGAQGSCAPSRRDLLIQDSVSSTNHQSPVTSHATVYLIGAGPGDPDLLTVKAFRLLQSADLVLHDALVSDEILALIPASSERINVGKRRGFRLLTQDEINSLLVGSAQKHRVVVRLKGGDPLLFGRAAEEIQALRGARIAFEIVPGISSAFAAAAGAKVSLTDRRIASHVLFTTFSRSPEVPPLPLVGLTSETTVVVYMPGPDYSGVSRWLLDSGIVGGTPLLLISKASRPGQAVRSVALSQLASLAPLPAPALLIVGRVTAQVLEPVAALGMFNASLASIEFESRIV